MKKLILGKSVFLVLFLLTMNSIYAQVGIGTNTPSPNAILDLTTSSKGFLLPRVSTTQRISMTPNNTTDKGLQVYDSTLNAIMVWNGIVWAQQGSKNIYDANGDIAPLSATNRTVDFTNGGSLNIDNNTLHINASNNRVGIGTSTPAEILDVNGKTKTTNFQMTNGAAVGNILTSDASGNASWSTPATIPTYTGSTSVVLNGTSFERAALTGDITASQNSNATTISNDAVTSVKILNGSITTADLAVSSVTTEKIVDGTIAAADLSTMSATTGQLLRYNGTVWAPYTLDSSSAPNLYTADGSITTNRVVNITGSVDFQNASTSKFKISQVGAETRVGVNNSTPLNLLHVSDGTVSDMSSMFGKGLALTNGTSSTRVYLEAKGSTSGERVFQIENSGGVLKFNSLTDNASATTPVIGAPGIISMKASNNYVGIGQNNPTERLDVNGKTKTTNFQMTNGAAAGNILISDASGNASWSTPATIPTYTGSTSVALNGTSFERAALTGDITASQNSNATTISNDAVTSTKILNGTIENTDLNNGVGGIYKGSGTLSGATTVTQAANILAFTSTATNGFSVDGTTFSVDAANNRVGIGTASPQNIVHISDGSSSNMTSMFGKGIALTAGSTGSTRMYIENTSSTSGERVFQIENANGLLKFNALNDDASATVPAASAPPIVSMKSTNNFVGIGTDNPSEKLTVSNGTTIGTYTTSGWQHSSDRRLKTNIVPVKYALDIIGKLNGVYFNWNNKPNTERQVGFIAQDVQNVLPEVVTGKEGDLTKGETLGMAYQNIVPVLVEAIKEQQSMIEKQQKQINDLKLEVEKLKK